MEGWNFSMNSFDNINAIVRDGESANKNFKWLNRLCLVSNFRYLVASRDLKANELIIEADALVIGPCAESLPICLGCYVDLFQLPRKYL